MLGKGGGTTPRNKVKKAPPTEEAILSAAAAWAGTRVQELDIPKSALSKSSTKHRERSSSSDLSRLTTATATSAGPGSAAIRESGSSLRSPTVGAVSQPQSFQVGGFAVYRQLDPQLLSTLAALLTDIFHSKSLLRCQQDVCGLLDELLALTGAQALQAWGEMDEIADAISAHQSKIKHRAKEENTTTSTKNTTLPSTTSPLPSPTAPPSSPSKVAESVSGEVPVSPSSFEASGGHKPGDQTESFEDLSELPSTRSMERDAEPSGHATQRPRVRGSRRKHAAKKKPRAKELELVCSRIEQIGDAALLASTLAAVVRTFPETMPAVTSHLQIDPSQSIQEALLSLSSTREAYLLRHPESEGDSPNEP